MRNKAYRRAMKAKKKTKGFVKIINEYTEYAPHVGYIDWDFVDGIWQPVGRYVKYPKNSARQRFLKKQSNRRVRRSEVPQKAAALIVNARSIGGLCIKLGF